MKIKEKKMREVLQEFIDGSCIRHDLSKLVLKNIRLLNTNILEIYQNIDEENRFYSKTHENLNGNEIELFYQHAKDSYQNADIYYDKKIEKSTESWEKLTIFVHKKSIEIQVSDFGRIIFDGKIVKQYDMEKDKGYLYVKEVGTTKKVWNLVADSWLRKPNTECPFAVHHISNNGYDQRPENLIFLTMCEHKYVHPDLPMKRCKICFFPEKRI